MRRQPTECYAYKNNELCGHYQSVKDASMAIGDSPPTIFRILNGEAVMSPRAYIYTKTKLTEEQIENLPSREDNENIPRNNQACKKQLGNQELEVDCKDHKVFFLERNKEARKLQLRRFIYSRLHFRWSTVPQKVSVMEKHFVDQLLDSL